MEYNKENPLRCFFAFAGYDSQMMALQRLKDNFTDFDFSCVGWSEIDKNAIIAHNACFPMCKDKNFGNISMIDWDKVPDFDLFTMSSPCQDFSLSGKRKGGEEGSGTRSSLLWECTKAIQIKRPKYVFFENVKGLVTDPFIKGFHKWQRRLDGFGYTNFSKVLDAQDFGVPQKRERVYMVSILGAEQHEDIKYYFPNTFELMTRIKDLVEKEVDESYYLSEKALENLCNKIDFAKKKEEGKRIQLLFNPDNSGDEICRTLKHSYNGCRANLARQDRLGQTGILEIDYKNKTNTIAGLEDGMPKEVEPQIVGYSRDKKGDLMNIHFKHIANTVHTLTGKGWNTDQYVAEPIIAASRGKGVGNRQHIELNGSGTSNTITSVSKDNYLLEPTFLFDEPITIKENVKILNGTKLRVEGGYIIDEDGFYYRIRKLTPRECFRLMDVEEHYIDNIQNAGISKTNQYKLAGNSIVVNCMYHIFRKLFVEKENENRQLELF